MYLFFHHGDTKIHYIFVSLQPEPKHVRIMTAFALNNLWSYIDGLSLKQKDREWLAGKLLEPKPGDAKTARQQAYVKETLTRALQEVNARQKDTPRAGWAAAAKQAHADGEDKLMAADFFDDEPMEDWQW